MITDGEKWHYLTVKNLSGLLRGLSGLSTHYGDFHFHCQIALDLIEQKVN